MISPVRSARYEPQLLRVHAPLGDFIFEADSPAEAESCRDVLLAEGFQAQIVHGPGQCPISRERQAAFGLLVRDWHSAKLFAVGLVGDLPPRALWLIGWACLWIVFRRVIGR